MSESIASISSDIKWLVSDSKRRNGIMEEHVKDSDEYRARVDRNTTWRHAYKFVFGFVFIIIGVILKHIVK